jgi:hypothetical protein
MASPFPAAAIIVLGLLANSPASAQRAADAGPVLPAEALGLPPEAGAQAPGIAARADRVSIGEFLHRTTVQRPGEWIAFSSNAAADAAQDASHWLAVNVSAAQDTVVSGSQAAAAMAKNASQWFAGKVSAVAGAAQETSNWIGQGSNAAVIAALNAGEWAASGANAVGAAAQGTGEWIAIGANAVMRAAQNSGELVAAGSNAAVNAARGGGQWITGGAQATVSAVQDTGQWVAASTSAAVSATAGAASALVSGVMALEDWSISLVKRLEGHLRADAEFAALMRESGFALSNIKVGVGMIPELDLEFKYERGLSPQEIAAYKAKINNHVSKAPAPLGYFEKLVLRRLLKAGEMSGGMRISELHIDLVPLPGLEVFFDPLRLEEEQDRMLAEAYGLAKSGQKNLKSIEERISRIEALAMTPQTRK